MDTGIRLQTTGKHSSGLRMLVGGGNSLSEGWGEGGAKPTLGLMYDGGRGGILQNYDDARFYFTLAAAQGHKDAQFYVGFMYRNWQGTPLNYGQALKWYTLAADQGHAEAQHNLGVMYYNGRGTPRNYVKAMERSEEHTSE